MRQKTSFGLARPGLWRSTGHSAVKAIPAVALAIAIGFCAKSALTSCQLAVLAQPI